MFKHSKLVKQHFFVFGNQMTHLKSSCLIDILHQKKAIKSSSLTNSCCAKIGHGWPETCILF